MAKSTQRKFEQRSSRPPILKPAPRPAPKLAQAREEPQPSQLVLLADEERKSLVLKLIDFLETF